MPEPWSLVETGFRLEPAKAWEGLFTLGSGPLQVRGSLEEPLGGAPQNRVVNPLDPGRSRREEIPVKWGTYAPGLLGQTPTLRRQMVNLPFFLELSVTAGDETLDMRSADVADCRRELDLRRAVLTRSLRWRTRTGAVLELVFERFVSAARPPLCVQRLSISSDRDVTLTIRGGIDANVTTCDSELFDTVELGRPADDAVECQVVINTGHEATMRTVLTCNGAAWTYEATERTARLSAELCVGAGRSVVVEKRTAVATSRDRAPCPPGEVLDREAGRTYEQLLDEHASIWAQRWEASEVTVEGDPDSQLALRVSIYHLLRALCRGDDRVSIGAKGFAGEQYQGLFFWDSEMFILPFFLYTDPAEARCLADFRVQALPGARRNAAAYKYGGARYPWTSDDQGDECCGPWIYKDHQLHVTADVVYGLVHYARATGDVSYLRGPAANVLVETARYWLQRIDRRTGDERPHLLGVMGPDEFTAMTSNNSYTNRLVRLALEAAAEYGETGGATEDERRAFAQVAAALPMPRAADGGLVLQCEEYDQLADIDIDALWTHRRIPFEWQVPRERIHRSKCLKQADVIMLMMLFPHEYTHAEVRRAWEHYVPATTHDSSLSAGAHAVVAARLGMADRAWAFWRRSAAVDLDLERGGAAEGIHIAAAGMNWQVAVLGFGGMATAMQSDVLSLTPRLPCQWSRLGFHAVWKGCPVDASITHEDVTLINRGDVRLPVEVAGTSATLAPGERRTFPL